jgi:hypothetical protein
MTLSIMTHGIMALSLLTLSIMTLSIIALSIMTLIIMSFSIQKIKCDTQHDTSVVILNVVYAECCK